MKITKKEAIVLVGVLIGSSFVFFILGIMFQTYNLMMWLESIEINKVILNLNETKMVDYAIQQKSLFQ